MKQEKYCRLRDCMLPLIHTEECEEDCGMCDTVGIIFTATVELSRAELNAFQSGQLSQSEILAIHAADVEHGFELD